MPDFLKELLPDWYKQNAQLTVIAVFALYNCLAFLTCVWVKQSVKETRTEATPTQIQVKSPIFSASPTQIEVNAPISTGDCSASTIGHAAGVSIQCEGSPETPHAQTRGHKNRSGGK